MEPSAKAIQLIRANRFIEAKKLCQDALAAEPRDQQAIVLLARIAAKQGDLARAAQFLDRALDVAPPTAPILLEYGRLLIHQNRPEDAVIKLESAASMHRGWRILTELGAALLKSGNPVRARLVLEEALKMNPDSSMAMSQLAVISYLDEEPDKFLELAQRTLALNPNDLRIATYLILVYLQQSKPQAALALCDNLLSRFPSLTGVYGFKYIALAETGRIDAARELHDLNSLIKRIPARCPSDFSSIDEFNEALAEHVLHSAERSTNHDRYTTRSGWQTENGKLFEHNKELGAIAEQMIMSAIDEYISMLPTDPKHPVQATRPPKPALDPWCVVLDKGGHQAPHMHPNGWLSGVYYIRLPDDFNAQKNRDAGCITFGRGKKGLHRVEKPETLTLRPEEGYFFLFPSYFWHHTIPLDSSQNRICLAFDFSGNVKYPDAAQ